MRSSSRERRLLHACTMTSAALLVLAGVVACSSEDAGGFTRRTVRRADAAADASVERADASAAEPVESPDAAIDADRSSGPLRVVVLGDLNGSYGDTTYEASVHDAVAAIVDVDKPDLVLISGDMVAGQKAGLDYPAMWAGFHAAVTNKLVAAGIPVAPAPGNHDASAYAPFAAERSEYERQWKPSRLPAVQIVDGSRFPFRYSFMMKGALFVAIDATTIEPLAGEQRQWVETQLEGAGPYAVRIVYGHVPLHPTTVGRETEVLADDAFEAVLAEKNALFVGGHHHGYYPGVANGVRQVVTPCIGSGPRALIGTSHPSARGYVVIDIADGKVTSIEARTGTNFESNIVRASLPTELRSGAHLLSRDDLGGF